MMTAISTRCRIASVSLQALLRSPASRFAVIKSIIGALLYMAKLIGALLHLAIMVRRCSV